jgi:hypothetical protein
MMEELEGGGAGVSRELGVLAVVVYIDVFIIYRPSHRTMARPCHVEDERRFCPRDQPADDIGHHSSHLGRHEILLSNSRLSKDTRWQPKHAGAWSPLLRTGFQKVEYSGAFNRHDVLALSVRNAVQIRPHKSRVRHCASWLETPVIGNRVPPGVGNIVETALDDHSVGRIPERRCRAFDDRF